MAADNGDLDFQAPAKLCSWDALYAKESHQHLPSWRFIVRVQIGENNAFEVTISDSVEVEEDIIAVLSQRIAEGRLLRVSAGTGQQLR
jgi:hypothetical protein